MSAQPRIGIDYPLTRRTADVDTIFRTQVRDPYRWLEDMNDPETRQWAVQQDSVARALASALPGRAAVLDRINAIRPRETIHAPHKRGERYFFVRRTRSDSAVIEALVIREGRAGPERVLVSAQTHSHRARFAAYAGTAIPSFQVSPDGRLVAYGIVDGTSLWSRWYVRDAATGHATRDTIVGIHVGSTATISWSHDGTALYYAAYSHSDSLRLKPTNQRLFRHRIGEPQSRDVVVYEDPRHPNATYWGVPSHDGRYFVVVANDGLTQRLFVKDWQVAARPPAELTPDPRAIYSPVDVRRDTLWLRTSFGAPNRRLVAVPLQSPTLPNWREILPERADAILQGVQFIHDGLLASYTKDALPLVQFHDIRGQLVRTIKLPYLGWLPSGFVGTRGDPAVGFEIQGTADPGSAYVLDVRTGRSTLFAAPRGQFDASSYVTRQVFFTSKDGTRIPMIVMHKRGLKPDGSHPAWLYAYGARWVATPWYAPEHRVWLELGGVYALANVRGGGEYGQPWIDAGSAAKKQNGIDDYIAAAEWLVREGYSSKTGLVANGGSASGPLAAAAVNQRPDLFGVGVISYGYSDLVRFEDFAPSGAVPTFGSARDSTVFPALYRWSPYHNVRPGVCYPPMFLGHGDRDPTAVTWHSYKLAAALQAAQACKRPIVLQIAWGRGHTVGGPEEVANQLAFVAAFVELAVPPLRGHWPDQ